MIYYSNQTILVKSRVLWRGEYKNNKSYILFNIRYVYNIMVKAVACSDVRLLGSTSVTIIYSFLQGQSYVP